MLEKLNKDAIHRMDQAVEHVVLELTKVRTGRANPDLLNSIQNPREFCGIWIMKYLLEHQ